MRSLTRDQQQAFLALQNAKGHRYSPLLGIAKTNMLPLGASDGSGGLFLEASRINHSCQPNAQHTWNASLGRLTGSRPALHSGSLRVHFIASAWPQRFRCALYTFVPVL